MTDPARTRQGEAHTEVRLLGLSLAALQRASEHTDELRREFAIMRVNDHQGVPVRLLALMAELEDRYSAFVAGVNSEVETAVERGDATMDLIFRLPDHAGEASRRLLELLDEADDYCRDGSDLLTLATPPDAIDFRHWYLGEIIRQIAGEPPTPWSDSATANDGDLPPEDARLIVTASPRGSELVLTLIGDIDLAVTDELRGRFLDVHERTEPTVVLDLAGVGFMDSTGLSVLISAWKRLKGDDRELILQNPTAATVQLLNTCGLTDMFKVRST